MQLTFKKLFFLALPLVTILSFNGCRKDAPFVPFFPLSSDKTLGAQVEAEIASMPAEYPVLDSASNKTAYAYIYKMRDKILNSGVIVYKNDFAWKIKIIKDDNTLNAFCTPGGYIYVYTGLIKYLDSEDDLAGVVGHEMAHADRRHTSRSLQTQYGVSILADIVLGNNAGALSEIAKNIYLLKNSREHESEADDYSVRYLCPTDYRADGASNFFEKLINEGKGGGSDFFSTHPSPEKRVEAIRTNKATLGCAGTQTFDQEYASFKASL